MERKVEVLVADAGPFIKGDSLNLLSNNVVTIRDVVSEIKDANTRQRLQVLPYELSFKQPSALAIHHVSEFARKTGDYMSLSPVDIKLLALTYQLECEHGPHKGANIRSEPLKSTYNKSAPVIVEDTISQQIQLLSIVEESHPIDSNGDNCEDNDGLSRDINNNVVEPSVENSRTESEDSECGDEESFHDNQLTNEDDQDDGWITPANLQQVRNSMGGASEEKFENIAVGCITTDYAIQNVLLQMGLNVVSLNGMLIKRLQTYALRCKACYHTTFKFAKYFCQFCGHRTLMKVRADVDCDGRVQFYPLSSKQFSRKGLRYSVPLPKGGRQSNMHLISPNQRITFRLPRSREKVNPLDPDYVARGSPFRANDVTSRGAQIGFRQGRRRAGGRPHDGWKRNPNEVKKKTK